MTYSQDNAGTLRIGRTSMLGSLSYHFSLDKKQRHVLTLGYQWGNHGFKVKNIQDAVPEDQITGGSSLDMSGYVSVESGATFLAAVRRWRDRWKQSDTQPFRCTWRT